MEMRELLDKITDANKALLRMERKIDNLGEAAEKATSTMSAVRYGGTPDHCKHEYAVLETDAVEKDMAELRIRLRVLRSDLQPYIGMMPPGPERAAAQMRYLEGMSCNAIGRRLSYARQHIYILLDNAAATLSQIYKASLPQKM